MQAAALASAIFDTVDPDYLEERREKLRQVFESFSNGPEMDGRAFAKLCKDTGLLRKTFTTTDVDLIFAQVKDSNVRKIGIQQFRNALDTVARKIGVTMDEAIDIVITTGGPMFQGTKAEVTGSIAAPLKAAARRGSAGRAMDSPSGPSSSTVSIPMVSIKKRAPMASAPLSPAQEIIKEFYVRYSPYGEMDGKTFAKVAKDAGLIDKNLTAVDIDIIFARVKDKAARRVNVGQFEDGLRDISAKKGVAFEAVAQAIQETDGPLFEATVAQPNRFSDRSEGGVAESANLPIFLDGKDMSSRFASFSSDKQLISMPSELKEAFTNFANGAEMDGASFLKVAKDSQILDKTVTDVIIDLVFAKIVRKGERKISLDQFNEGLMEIAERKNTDYSIVVSAVIKCGGPQFVGTKTDSVKWYDDKSTFTGMHNAADAGTEPLSRTASSSSSKMGRAPSSSGKAEVKMPAMLVPPAQMESLQNIFHAFANTGEMDGRTFQKLVRDAGLLGKALTATDVDLIFTRVKHVSTKKLIFDQFISALAEISTKIGREHQDVALSVIKVGGPQFVGTKTDCVKFYDDKSYFTGMHGDDEARRESFVQKQAMGDTSASTKPPPADHSDELRWVFEQYAQNGEVEGKTFAKLMRDAGAFDKKLTIMEIDLVFTKVSRASKCSRKIDYKQFLDAVGECALRKTVAPSDLVTMILGAGGPQFSGTVAMPNKFHDDKSLYTGMHADDLSEREEQRKPMARRMIVSQSPASSLQEVFLRFSPAGEMDGRTFCKVARDAEILDKNLTSIDIDIIFAKIKDKSARRISYNQFDNGVEELSAKMGVTHEQLVKILMQLGGPIIEGTVAEANRFHDDKSLYTGTHGKPSLFKPDPGLTSAIARDTSMQAKQQQTFMETGFGPAESIDEVFELFAPSGGMDGKSFAKIARDAKILDRNLTAADVDLTFAKVKGKGTKIVLSKFLEGIKYLAEKKKVEYDALCDQIMDAGGPRLVGTQAEENKFFDRSL